jgi:hypothetical protein
MGCPYFAPQRLHYHVLELTKIIPLSLHPHGRRSPTPSPLAVSSQEGSPICSWMIDSTGIISRDLVVMTIISALVENRCCAVLWFQLTDPSIGRNESKFMKEDASGAVPCPVPFSGTDNCIARLSIVLAQRCLTSSAWTTCYALIAILLVSSLYAAFTHWLAATALQR